MHKARAFESKCAFCLNIFFHSKSLISSWFSFKVILVSCAQIGEIRPRWLLVLHFPVSFALQAGRTHSRRVSLWSKLRAFSCQLLAHHVSAAENFFCSVFAEIALSPTPRTPCIGTAAAGADAHALDAKGLQVHEDRGSFLHLCCKKGERLKLRRDGDGGRERERRLLCFPSPPSKQRGNVSAERR